MILHFPMDSSEYQTYFPQIIGPAWTCYWESWQKWLDMLLHMSIWFSSWWSDGWEGLTFKNGNLSLTCLACLWSPSLSFFWV